MNQSAQTVGRRDFLRSALRNLCVLGTGAAAGFLAGRSSNGASMLWQIDPEKCIACNNCTTNCVLPQSAAKAVHSYAICGYCDLCTGYFNPSPNELNTGAENVLCPTGAIKRKFVEEPFYEYTIDKDLCIGCGKCVKGCTAFGNGSLYMQVSHDLCLNCNECAIASACPSRAFTRVPSTKPYILKKSY